MNIIFAIALILAVTAAYMFVIEAFSVAFKLTGLATKKIRFQVASLFTGTGFTTNESELIVNDDRRRRIAVTCMYTSHVFSVVIMGLLINLVISLVASITNKPTITAETFTSWYAIVFYVSFAIFLIVVIIKIPPVNRRFQLFLEKIAIALSGNNRKSNILSVFDMYGKSAIVEVFLNRIPEFAKDVPLSEMQLTKKYLINILSIKRKNRPIEVTKDTMFVEGDLVVMFGLINDIKEAFINLDDNSQSKQIKEINRLSLLNNYGSNVLMEVEVDEVPKELENIPMKDSHLADRYNITIVVIKRNDEYLFVDKDTIIQKGDKITLFGPFKTIKHLFRND